jgi:hypothetical protein
LFYDFETAGLEHIDNIFGMIAVVFEEVFKGVFELFAA